MPDLAVILAYLVRLAGMLVVCGTIDACLATASADYKISPGDVLGLTVIGVPDLTVRSAVDDDGKATFPLVGSLKMGGLTAEEATAKLQGILPGKELNRHLDDGREIPVIISKPQISVVVAEFRPIYINGDVGKPGELPYRIGLTVRKAMALAGGLDTARFKTDNPLLQISDLTGEYNDLWIEYAKWQGSVGRLQSELDGKQQLDAETFSGVPIPQTLSAQLLKNEQDQLKAHTLDFEKERAYLTLASQKETQRAQILGQQETQDLEGLKLDTADLQRYEELFRKGAVAVPALSEARRTVLGSSTRALQTSVALFAVQRDQGDLARRLERLDDVRRVELLKELQEATTSLAVTRAKLQVVSTKLRYMGVDKSRLLRDVESMTNITITRTEDGKVSHFKSGPDETVQPGDVIEVVLENNQP